jgi:hypothetical protein
MPAGGSGALILPKSIEECAGVDGAPLPVAAGAGFPHRGQKLVPGGRIGSEQ